MAKTPTLILVRQRIDELKTEAQTLTAAPRARAEVRADILAWCEMQASEARTAHVVQNLAFGSSLEGALTVRPNFGGALDLAPLLAALIGPERLAEALGAHLDGVADGPTSAGRTSRLAAIDTELFDAERSEEQVIEAAEARGEHVARRGDADPRAVLWLDDHANADTGAVTAAGPDSERRSRLVRSEYLARGRS